MRDYELVERKMRVFGKEDSPVGTDGKRPSGFTQIGRSEHFGNYLTKVYKSDTEQIMIEIYRLRD